MPLAMVLCGGRIKCKEELGRMGVLSNPRILCWEVVLKSLN